MTRWAKNAKEFTVSVILHKQRGTYRMHVPTPILKELGNPKRATYLIRENMVILRSPDARDREITPSTRESSSSLKKLPDHARK